ncbi:MAG: hypothetical protein MRY72_05490 [Aquisalinus sp.]|nr:hypothetical protein [Aquisalinus sp.]
MQMTVFWLTISSHKSGQKRARHAQIVQTIFPDFAWIPLLYFRYGNLVVIAVLPEALANPVTD